jgi:hypothetical protein
MNTYNTMMLIETLKAIPPEKFNMRYYLYERGSGEMADLCNIDPDNFVSHDCGTTACIAGWASLLSGEKEGMPWNVARDWLDIDFNEATWLFHGKFSNELMEDIPLPKAIEALEYVLSGKSVDDDTDDSGWAWVKL